jgi:hypothetical protein
VESSTNIPRTTYARAFALMVVATVLVSMTLLLEHEFIYKALIVPRLPGVHSVPMMWWLGESSLTIIAALGLGAAARNFRDVFMSSIGSSTACVFFSSWASLTDQPGHRNAEPGLAIAGLPIYVILFFVLHSVGTLLPKIASHFRPAAQGTS